MLTVEMLPGGNGDALWIELGDEAAPRRILVDGGTDGTWEAGLRERVAALPPGDRHFELVVVTHVDADHIDGVLGLLREEELGISCGDVWFNGWRHLPDTPLESLGPVEGEQLTDLILAEAMPWNAAFQGRAVGVPNEGPLPRIELGDDLALTILSPGAEQLARLKPVWRKAVVDAGLEPGQPRAEPTDEPAPGGLERLGPDQPPDVDALARSPFTSDTAAPNGSTIAFLLEHGGRSLLLTGDAFPGVLARSLQRLSAERELDGRVPVDALKVPHHGSHANVSSELLAGLDCGRFLFSSNGAHTRHPHPEAVARALAAAPDGAQLLFNYRSRFNEIWDDDGLRDRHAYSTTYPSDGSAGLAVTV
jgi:Metallo-beta-lactamase superfamily